MCIRQVGPRSLGDLLLEPTTHDEIGERTDTVAFVEKAADGKYYLYVCKEGLVLRHTAEEDVLVPPGIYRIGKDLNWGGAPLMGLCHEG